jgi:membrane protease YdiL (CAAX protease family)
MSIPTSKTFRLSELILFMLVVPVALWLLLPSSAILPVVWGMALFCHWLGRKSPVAYAAYGWNWAAVNRANLVPMLARFAFCTLLLGVGTWLLKPEMLWSFVREKPQLWAIVMVFYPLVSVVPQEIIFRRYLFARHADILAPALVMILVSGIGFGFAHIVFNNWVAPVLCVFGGVIFAYTYHKTRSLALVCIEHALYGDMVFTLGLGRYFYHGAVAVAQ